MQNTVDTLFRNVKDMSIKLNTDIVVKKKIPINIQRPWMLN